MSRKKNLCWTCSKCLTTKCPKHRTPEIEKQMWRTKVYECTEYDYDGECLGCELNVDHIKGALYDTCPYFIKGCRGYCAQENWRRSNDTKDNMVIKWITT